MIQLSSLPVTGPETPAKAAVAAAPAGVFASLLVGELGGGETASGKILPEGGKTLPDGLPVEGEAAQAARILSTQFGAKAKHAGSDEAAKGAEQSLAQPDAAEAEAGETVLEDRPEAPVATAVALTVELPEVLLPALAMPQPQDEPEQAEGETDTPRQGNRAAPRTVPLPSAAAVALMPSRHAAQLDSGEAPVQAGIVAETPSRAAAKTETGRAAKPAQEIRFELTRDAKPVNAGDLAHVRTGQGASAAMLSAAPAVQAQIPDGINAGTGARPALDTVNAQQALRPHEFTTLVDRLVEARESARGGSVNVAVMHADFGEVSLRFSQDNGNLTVSMSNQDPEFARAVNAAAPADGAQTGEAATQGRRDDGTQNASARAGSDARASTGESGSGRHGNGNDRQAERAEPQHRAAGQGGTAMGGIYA